VVSANGIQVYPSKIEAIQTWPQPKSVTEVRSLYGLASFNRRFIRDFSSFMARMKKGCFEWSKATYKAFEDIKLKLCQALVSSLSNFKDLFELEFDVNGVG